MNNTAPAAMVVSIDVVVVPVDVVVLVDDVVVPVDIVVPAGQVESVSAAESISHLIVTYTYFFFFHSVFDY